MSKISELKYHEGKLGFDWVFEKKHHSVKSNIPLVVVPFHSGKRFLVVEPASIEAPHNAYIFNALGAKLTQIVNPESKNGAICFSDAYYNHEDLNLIIAFSSFQKACVIDEEGSVTKVRESR